jgi:hypothetical protein
MNEVITDYNIENTEQSLRMSINNQHNEYWGYYDNPEQWCVHIKFEDNPYKGFHSEVTEFEYNKNIPYDVLKKFLFGVEQNEVDILLLKRGESSITNYFYAHIENEECPLISIFNMRKVDDEPYLYQATLR